MLISADSHLVEPQEALPKGAYWGTEGRLLVLGADYDCPTLYAQPAIARGSADAMVDSVLSMRECREAYDPETRLSVQSIHRVDAEVLYPTFALTAVETARTPEAAALAAQAYNEWAQATFKPPHFWPLMLAHIEPEAGPLFVGMAVGGAGLLLPISVLADLPAWEPTFEAAAATGTVLHWHGFAKPTPASFKGHPLLAGWQAFRAGQDVLVGLILAGVLHRHPKLKIVLAETDCGWVPHTAERLAYYISKYGRVLGLEAAELNVWEALFANVGFVTPRPQDMVKTYDSMWGWDWPHVDAHGPERLSNSVKAHSMHNVVEFYPQICKAVQGLDKAST